MKKNDSLVLEITDLTAEGSGVGRAEDSMTVFVPRTAVGDRVRVHIIKVKKNYAVGKVEAVERASEHRVQVDCPQFRSCGGCLYRHLNYAEECRLKQKQVENAIRRIGGVDLAAQPIVAAHTERYRNKAQFPISKGGKSGFFAAHSHRIIPCEDCLLQPEAFARAAKAVEEWVVAEQVSVYEEETGKGLVRHLYLRAAKATGEWMVVLVLNGKTAPNEAGLVERLRAALGEGLKSVQINVNQKDTNVVLGEENRVLYGQAYITDILCGVRLRISPLSFYQVNRDMAERLYEKAAEYARPEGKEVLDLYCGIGSIGLSMAKKAKQIIGVEIVEAAVRDARANAVLNGFENTRFLCATATRAAEQLAREGIRPEVVIVDPPRKGCDEALLKTVAQDFCPERLVYVSCDPATLARDVAVLSRLGYELKEYTPFDLFPRTGHVETVALLSREKADDYIRISARTKDLKAKTN